MRGPLYCYLLRGGKWTDAFQTSNAETLVKIAGEPRIFVLIPGFYWNLQPFPDTGAPSLDYVRGRWQEHLALIASLHSRAAACLATLDSTDGFGSHERVVGSFLTALRWLTDSPRFFDPRRTIAVVGHSAGGNFAKSAYLQFLDKWSRIGGAQAKGYRATRTDFVFLATPHLGTDVVVLVQQGGALLEMIGDRGNSAEPTSYEERAERDFAVKRRAEMTRIYDSKGARQLLPKNAELIELDRRFLSAAAGRDRIFNLYSSSDLVAGPETASLRALPGAREEWFSLVEEIKLDGLGHSEFMSAPGLAANAATFRRVYGPPS